jgi:hypothetical protein
LWLFISADITAQTRTVCDTIYKTPQQAAHCNNDIDFSKFVINALPAILDSCVNANEEIITKLNLVLTINALGNIVEVQEKRNSLQPVCIKGLQQKLALYKGWHAGKVKNTEVCSYVSFPINCIKWD